ncbi:hypothetical protein ACPOL_3152 [Acidisarcina polymorpha]|uniref:Uncharacterized protein n=1 Tax=Acidisarcina polymorpha TaxID=2211140 RepID=A0A2Z5G159_9BACT|nr:hypothetical protein ACPOL_3152 [Acidisarcina polymorpha]
MAGDGLLRDELATASLSKIPAWLGTLASYLKQRSRILRSNVVDSIKINTQMKNESMGLWLRKSSMTSKITETDNVR